MASYFRASEQSHTPSKHPHWVTRMKEKLQASSSALVQYDEELCDLHGRGVLDGFDLKLFGFQTNWYQEKNIVWFLNTTETEVVPPISKMNFQAMGFWWCVETFLRLQREIDAKLDQSRKTRYPQDSTWCTDGCLLTHYESWEPKRYLKTSPSDFPICKVGCGDEPSQFRKVPTKWHVIMLFNFFSH